MTSKEWHKNTGVCPVPSHAKVCVRYRDGEARVVPLEAYEYKWALHGTPGDIVEWTAEADKTPGFKKA